MNEPIEFRPRPEQAGEDESNAPTRGASAGLPSNEVYARVGDAVLLSAQDGVRRGLRPEDIIREIRTTHGVQLNVGELRLLLASRRI